MVMMYLPVKLPDTVIFPANVKLLFNVVPPLHVPPVKIIVAVGVVPDAEDMVRPPEVVNVSAEEPPTLL